MGIPKKQQHEVLDSIYDCAVNWISDDADNPVTPPKDWQRVLKLLHEAIDVARLEHA